jgi:hypothetical protein
MVNTSRYECKKAGAGAGKYFNTFNIFIYTRRKTGAKRDGTEREKKKRKIPAFFPFYRATLEEPGYRAEHRSGGRGGQGSWMMRTWNWFAVCCCLLRIAVGAVVWKCQT